MWWQFWLSGLSLPVSVLYENAEVDLDSRGFKKAQFSKWVTGVLTVGHLWQDQQYFYKYKNESQIWWTDEQLFIILYTL